MKPIKTIIAVTSVILILNYCDENALELTNPNELTPEIYFKSEADVRAAVNAIYTVLQTRGLYQRTLYFAMDNMAHEQTMNPSAEPDNLQFSKYTFNAINPGIADYWKSCYEGIYRANFVISNSDAIDRISEGQMSQIKKKKYIGEARFLRAFYYFLLVTRFGDVPMITEYPAENSGYPRSPKSEIWNLIETDLQAAAEGCLSKRTEEKGRATSGAAWALLGKAHLFQANESNDQADFANAKSAFLKLINDESYYLEAKYSDNFKEETEHGPESIFEVEFNPNLGTNDIWASEDNGSGRNEGTFRCRYYGFFDWYTVTPTQNMVDEFETLADNGVKEDPRLGYCIYRNGDLYNNGADTVIISDDTLRYYEEDGMKIEVWRRYGWRKYQNYYKQKFETNASGINCKVIRLADVILMMAEVENNLGNFQEAIAYLNRVRNRNDVMMPNYGTPEMNSTYPVSNQEQILKAIEHERKIELCNEQVRINDLIRWRRLEDFMEEIKRFIQPHWIKNGFNFNAEIHYLWPIPQSEIDLNPALTPSDQNPGY